jgi:hypothetical protein
MDEILDEFRNESKQLLAQMSDALEIVEEDSGRTDQLESFGQIVDRMMGGAKSIAMGYPPEHNIHLISKFCELCKAIGYKSSQVKNNSNLTQISAALLLDATETLEDLVNNLAGEQVAVKDVVTKTFLDRLNWVLKHFDPNLRGSVAINSQADIDKMLKNLGLG